MANVNKDNFDEVMSWVVDDGLDVNITREGKTVAVMMPFDSYVQMKSLLGEKI